MANLKVCSIEGCDKPIYARDLCNMHYQRLRRHGDPFVTKCRVGPNNCGKDKCPAADKLYQQMYHIQNSERRSKKNKEWRNANAKYYKKSRESYLSREDVKIIARARARQWAASNPERFRQTQLEHRINNAELYRSRSAKRRARKREAMPSWLTPDHISQINAVYAEARRLEKETGITHHVDHIVPLAGKIVCGLHVPWNLRAIPGTENLRRPRIYSMDMDQT